MVYSSLFGLVLSTIWFFVWYGNFNWWNNFFDISELSILFLYAAYIPLYIKVIIKSKDYNKFEEMNLTPGKAKCVQCPIIEESPLCIECRVKEVIPLGSHDMFIAEVLNVKADEKYLEEESGKFDLVASGLMAYVHGGYYELGKKIGKFGWSVEKKK
jgi:flavin reductase (DIM6/NTAB) family NADH-FMN oxidoreductase RutF